MVRSCVAGREGSHDRRDIRADLNAEDHTGYVWAFLDEARDPLLITPDTLVVAGDEDAPAVAVVVDLVEHPNGTIVHLDVLPGALDSYLALARRVAPAAQLAGGESAVPPACHDLTTTFARGSPAA